MPSLNLYAVGNRLNSEDNLGCAGGKWRKRRKKRSGLHCDEARRGEARRGDKNENVFQIADGSGGAKKRRKRGQNDVRATKIVQYL